MGMRWDRCESQLHFCLAVVTCNHLDVLSVQGRFWSLEHLEVFSNDSMCFPGTKNSKRQALWPSSFPDHALCSFTGHLGSEISPETQKMESMGGQEKGDCKALSIWPHQITQSNKTWCENNLCADLCLEEALSNMQKVVQHNPANRCGNDTKLW